MIKIEFNPESYTLNIKGHADYGKKGEDIVCAAVSTLFYTLADCLCRSEAMLAEGVAFNYEDGTGHISCKPKAEYEANISLMYWTVLNGIELVEKNYEKNIKLYVVGQK